MKKLELNDEMLSKMFEVLSDEQCCEIQGSGCASAGEYSIVGGGCQIPAFFGQAW